MHSSHSAEARLIDSRSQEEKKAEEAQKPISIPLEPGGQITIKIEIQPKGRKRKPAPGGRARERFLANPYLPTNPIASSSM